jgi:serine/threonine protein kinase
MSTEVQSARTIFLDALERPAPADRKAFVNSACGGDASLRAEVLRLLDAHGGLDNFMDRPAAAVVNPTIELPAGDQIGATIGRYKLLEQIGEGGMGVVYVAEQTEPVRRRVALKIIKPGMDTRQVIARFEAERQALAMMDHPNIAKVLDGGSTDDVGQAVPDMHNAKPNRQAKPDLRCGRPYFVMELVRGLPITDYCDQAKLDVRGRLDLFMTVCHAVQHAHQKGVIHRDLKPSNVLVTMHDGKPVAKVIDFGVAKATGQSLTERTIYTAFTEMIGTPLYMSPEQAELSGLDIDTRSDVYSLGVLLYELLTGQTPFDRDTLVKAGLDEVRRMIREDEPPRPSHRISTLAADAGSTVGHRRGIDQRQLSRTLDGELDWIVMKSLEKDRNRRYESASAFAADIERYLSHEPVEAGPPSTLYRFRKFARRRRGALIAITFVAASLLAGVGVSLWQAAEATSARQQAVSRLNIATSLLTLTGEQLADDLEVIPHASNLRRDLLEECIKFYDQFSEQDLRSNPSLRFAQARAMRNLSGVYKWINDGQVRIRGRDLLKQAISIQEGLSKDDPGNHQYLRELGQLYSDYALQLELGPGGYSQPLLELRTKSVDTFRLVASKDPLDTVARIGLAKSLIDLARHCGDELNMLPHQRDLAKAESLSREALGLVNALKVGGPEKKHQKLLAEAHLNLASTLRLLNKLTQSEPAYRKAVETYEQLLKQHPSDLEARRGAMGANSALAEFLREQGNFAEEEPIFNRSTELQANLVKDFPELSDYRVKLVWLFGTRGQFFVQQRMWRPAGDMYGSMLKHQFELLKIHPTKHNATNYRNSSFGHANILFELGETDTARDAFRESLRFAHLMVTNIPGGQKDGDIIAWMAFIEASCPFVELCDYDRALKVATHGMNPELLNPETDQNPFSDEHLALSMALCRAGDHENALKTLREDPGATKYALFNDVDRLLWRCRVLLDLGRFDQARAEFENAQVKAREIPPQRGDSMAYLARKRLTLECSEILAKHNDGAKETPATAK